MKTADYKIPASVVKDIPQLGGIVIKTREAENLEEFHTLVENGSPEAVLTLAQSALDIIVQRHIRNGAESEAVANILHGKTHDGTDYSEMDEAERLEAVRQLLQNIADEYVYGQRQPGLGGSKVVKEKAGNFDKVAAAAANDPELAAKLAALGFTV